MDFPPAVDVVRYQYTGRPLERTTSAGGFIGIGLGVRARYQHAYCVDLRSLDFELSGCGTIWFMDKRKFPDCHSWIR